MGWDSRQKARKGFYLLVYFSLAGGLLFTIVNTLYCRTKQTHWSWSVCAVSSGIIPGFVS